MGNHGNPHFLQFLGVITITHILGDQNTRKEHNSPKRPNPTFWQKFPQRLSRWQADIEPGRPGRERERDVFPYTMQKSVLVPPKYKLKKKHSYVDPPRGAKWMGKGAIKQPLRVQTPPIGGCWYKLISYESSNSMSVLLPFASLYISVAINRSCHHTQIRHKVIPGSYPLPPHLEDHPS